MNMDLDSGNDVYRSSVPPLRRSRICRPSHMVVWGLMQGGIYLNNNCRSLPNGFPTRLIINFALHSNIVQLGFCPDMRTCIKNIPREVGAVTTTVSLTRFQDLS